MSDMKHIANAMSQYGRQSDDRLVHMSRREVAALNKLAPGGLTTNPVTGLPEAFKLDDMIGPLLTAGASAAGYGQYAPYIAGAVGLGTYAATGNLSKGIAAGLLSYGAGEVTNYAMGNASLFGPGTNDTTTSLLGGAPSSNASALGALTASGAVAPTAAMIPPVDMEQIYAPGSSVMGGLADSTIASSAGAGAGAGAGIMAAADAPSWFSRNSSWALPGGMMALSAMSSPAGSGNVPKSNIPTPTLPPMVNGPVARNATMPTNFNPGYGPEQMFFPEAKTPEQQMAMQQAAAFTDPRQMQAQLALEAGGSGSPQQMAMLAQQRGYASGGPVSQTYRPAEQSFQMPLPNLNIALGSPAIKVAGGGYIDPKSPYYGYSMGQPGTPGMAEQGYYAPNNIPTSFAGIPGMPAYQPPAQPATPVGGGSDPGAQAPGGGIAGGIGDNAGGVDSAHGFTYPGGGSMDAKTYEFLNNYLGKHGYNLQQKRPSSYPMDPGEGEDFGQAGGGSTDQSWDQYAPTGGPGGMYNADLPHAPQPRTQATVSAQEEGQGLIMGQPSVSGNYSRFYDENGGNTANNFPGYSNTARYDENGAVIPSTSRSPSTLEYARAGLGLVGKFNPVVGAITGAYDGITGIRDGFNRAAYGERDTRPPPSMFGDNGGLVGRVADYALLGKGPIGWVGDKLGWLAGSVFGPGEPKTAAELSAEQSYSHKTGYDQSSGRVTAEAATPSHVPDWAQEAIARAQATGQAPQMDAGHNYGNGQGTWTPWYAGQSDPYSATGNMLNRPDNADFGSGRYEGGQFDNNWVSAAASPNPSYDPEWWRINVESGDGVNHGNQPGSAEGGPIRRRYAEGGQVQAPPEVQQAVIEEAKMAILGQSEQPEQAIQQFIQLFGQEALQQLVQQVQGHNGPVKGAGDGVDDFVPATVDGQEPVRLANDEHVLSADVVSALGNGSSEAGHKALLDMTSRVRGARANGSKMPNSIEPDEMLPA